MREEMDELGRAEKEITYEYRQLQSTRTGISSILGRIVTIRLFYLQVLRGFPDITIRDGRREKAQRFGKQVYELKRLGEYPPPLCRVGRTLNHVSMVGAVWFL